MSVGGKNLEFLVFIVIASTQGTNRVEKAKSFSLNNSAGV